MFALTPIVTDDGDRDGVPNVLVESMACGVPIVSRRTEYHRGADRERPGLLAQPEDDVAIAARLERLLGDPALRRSWRRPGGDRGRTVRCHANALQIAEMLTPKELRT